MIEALTNEFGFTEIKQKQAVPNSPMVYLVAQGDSLITLGQCKDSRRLTSLKGGSGKHNKKPLVSLCHKWRPNHPICFFLKVVDSASTATDLEREIHRRIGTLVQTDRPTSTVIEGNYKYQSAIDWLIAEIHNGATQSDRHLDLIDLVRQNGDVFGVALQSPRLKSVAIEIFGDFYVTQQDQTPVRVPANFHVPVDSMMANRNTKHHAVSRNYFRFTLADWQALQDPAVPGFAMHITGAGSQWTDGEVVVIIEKSDAAAWSYLEKQSQLGSFSRRRHFTDSYHVPSPLRHCIQSRSGSKQKAS
ncbi:MAG: hypothetical protein J0L82_18400 [Deltaproteobacteria bacterium]|nr:hypothetical protein [Deltaproteobacteria bacterium]